MSPTHHRSHSSGQGAAKGSGTLALGSASPMPGAGLRRCGGHPKGEQGRVSPSPCKLHWSPQNGRDSPGHSRRHSQTYQDSQCLSPGECHCHGTAVGQRGPPGTQPRMMGCSAPVQGRAAKQVSIPGQVPVLSPGTQLCCWDTQCHI